MSISIEKLFRFLTLTYLIRSSFSQTNKIILKDELKYLSELPLDKLLKVKKSLKEMSCLVHENVQRKVEQLNEVKREDFNITSFNWNNQSAEALPLLGLSGGGGGYESGTDNR